MGALARACASLIAEFAFFAFARKSRPPKAWRAGEEKANGSWRALENGALK
jgi:hypothetical protein